MIITSSIHLPQQFGSRALAAAPDVLSGKTSAVDMAEVAHSFSVQQSPANESARPHRPFLLGVLFGGLAVGGLVAVASLGREGAKFVAAPVGVAPLDSSASFRGVRQRANSPMMAADNQGNVDGVDYLFPSRREARTMMIETSRRTALMIRAVM